LTREVNEALPLQEVIALSRDRAQVYPRDSLERRKIEAHIRAMEKKIKNSQFHSR